METKRFEKWHPAARFTPTTNDLLFVKPGCYAHKTRVDLIIHWRSEAERIALNAVVLMIVGDLT